mgnify:CR=1 FL=1
MENAYKDVSAISIDIAVAEHTKKACVILASFTWHDIGSWGNFAALFAPCTTDKEALQVQTSNCFIYSDIPAVLCGVKDIIVVVKNGKLLILKKNTDASYRYSAVFEAVNARAALVLRALLGAVLKGTLSVQDASIFVENADISEAELISLFRSFIS